MCTFLILAGRKTDGSVEKLPSRDYIQNTGITVTKMTLVMGMTSREVSDIEMRCQRSLRRKAKDPHRKGRGGRLYVIAQPTASTEAGERVWAMLTYDTAHGKYRRTLR